MRGEQQYMHKTRLRENETIKNRSDTSFLLMAERFFNFWDTTDLHQSRFTNAFFL